jgi:hypothetical protein
MRLRLKMKILQTYGNQSNFARVCRKSDHWLSQIVTGRHEPTDAERRLILSNLPGCGKDLFKNSDVVT